MKPIIHNARRSFSLTNILLLFFCLFSPKLWATELYGVGYKDLTYIDKSRPIKASYNFKGTDDRRIDVSLWYPIQSDDSKTIANNGQPAIGKWPLVIYSHGTYGYPKNATHFVQHLVKQGYVVAAPTHPLTSRASFTNIPGPDVTDTGNQPEDVSFVIDQLLTDPFIGHAIDESNIGTTGHSLGAVTSYFLNYGVRFRNPKIKAHALIGGGEPVQAALSSHLGFNGVQHAPVSVPVLFLSAEKDVFANLTGRPYAAYSRVEPPKYEVMVHNGTHVWFRDPSHAMTDGRNPDCKFFDTNLPGHPIPGCLATDTFIDEKLQREITRTSLLDFFDAFLKDDKKALLALKGLGQRYKDVTVTYEDKK